MQWKGVNLLGGAVDGGLQRVPVLLVLLGLLVPLALLNRLPVVGAHLVLRGGWRCCGNWLFGPAEKAAFKPQFAKTRGICSKKTLAVAWVQSDNVTHDASHAAKLLQSDMSCVKAVHILQQLPHCLQPCLTWRMASLQGLQMRWCHLTWRGGEIPLRLLLRS